ncbi:MAG TPA: hypothetical protein VGM62_00205 [Chthoniobacterales bacterium]
MSTEEQNAIIVRLLRELTDTTKELALARESLRSTARLWSGLPATLEKAAKGDCMDARLAIGEALDPSVVSHARSLLDDIERLPRRIEEIRATLKSAGIEQA